MNRTSGGFWKRLLGGSGQISIRVDFGIVYERIGQGLHSAFDEWASFGLST